MHYPFVNSEKFRVQHLPNRKKRHAQPKWTNSSYINKKTSRLIVVSGWLFPTNIDMNTLDHLDPYLFLDVEFSWHLLVPHFFQKTHTTLFPGSTTWSGVLQRWSHRPWFECHWPRNTCGKSPKGEFRHVSMATDVEGVFFGVQEMSDGHSFIRSFICPLILPNHIRIIIESYHIIIISYRNHIILRRFLQVSFVVCFPRNEAYIVISVSQIFMHK